MRVTETADYRLTWRDTEALAAFEQQIEEGMAKAVQLCVGATKKKLNRGQPTKAMKPKRAEGVSGVKYYRVGLDPSKEGESPKKVTARLFQSITGRVERDGDKIVGKYGTNVKYAARLEFGFVGTDSAGRRINQGPRPFLRPVLSENQAKILKLLTGG